MDTGSLIVTLGVIAALLLALALARNFVLRILNGIPRPVYVVLAVLALILAYIGLSRLGSR